jgi:hypothetical protein
MLKTIRRYKLYDFEYVCPCANDIVGKPDQWEMWQRRVDWDFAWDVLQFEVGIRNSIPVKFRGRVLDWYCGYDKGRT